MASVTQRIRQIKQPRGGYLHPREFSVTTLGDDGELHPIENVNSGLVGMAVDYLTRFNNGTAARNAFKISLLGASIIREADYAEELVKGINGLDEQSVVNACRLAGYDVCFRASPMGYRPVQQIAPDTPTVDNIRRMVNRSMRFIEKYGPITKDGFTFEGGYTDAITTGDGDFLTETTLWDFKVSTKGPTNAHTLQLLIYYLMGTHSIHDEFQRIRNLGVFNPRLNTVYLLEIDRIPPGTLLEVEADVIGYE